MQKLQRLYGILLIFKIIRISIIIIIMIDYDLSTDINTNIENGPLCLPEKLRIAFLNHCSKIKCRDYGNDNVDDDECDYDECDEKVKNDLRKIKSIINENPEYNEDFVLPDGVKIKWNTLILPILANRKLESPSAVINNGDGNEYDDRFPSNFKKTLLSMLTDGVVPDEMIDLNFEKFIHSTRKCAPSLNGTACVGKSTILGSVSKYIREKHNLDAPIYKVSKLGGLKFKDKNDMIGMQMPLVAVHAVESTPVAIYDRCPFNNLIWRLIMTLFECRSDEEMVDTLCDHLKKTINYYTIQYMKTFPICVLIDTDHVANRARMQKRGMSNLPKITGCLHRCLVNNYCKAQNLVYFAFALMCEWPCMNVGEKFPLSGPKLEKLMFAFAKKCSINSVEGKPNSSLSQIQHDEFDILNYNYAKIVGAFK